MKHQRWIDKAREHLQEFQPTLYANLKAHGTLETKLAATAQATEDEMRSLLDSGTPPAEAQSQAEQMHLYPPPEPGAVEEQGATPGYLAALEYQKAMQEFNAL